MTTTTQRLDTGSTRACHASTTVIDIAKQILWLVTAFIGEHL